MKLSTYYIKVTGLVQGVGFRPFIYRIAMEQNLKGWVDNRNDGVHITVTGKESEIKSFIANIRQLAPLASNITSVDYHKTEFEKFNAFEIVKSKNISENITDVSPDITVCDDCLSDMKMQQHRINYPFINCTNCGPRFSIIKDLPYDREKTTMQPFTMCPECKTEYTNVYDRRFHAQPVACNNCGPHYSMHLNNRLIENIDTIVAETAKLIDSGKVVAIKGIGGFFIACDALNEAAVKHLREVKLREGKPFAVMFKNEEVLQEYCYTGKEELKLIKSWQKPIVLLKIRKKLAFSVAKELKTIGAMLPYMPFHYLIFEKIKADTLVFTSGNISDEPIIIDNSKAIRDLTGIADAIITYNRDIYNRVDDSVMAVFENKPLFLRRSRGYAPSPINLNIDVDGIIATGAELVNCFCIGKNNQAILSQHIGDLKNAETLSFYEESMERMKNLFRIKPKLIVSDLHPDYLSTKYAANLGLKHVQVQHHHAHIVACMAENNVSEKVIGVSFDGTGLGTDGNIWGGEFLICDYHSFTRYTHFKYIPMPGGDKASKENWRAGLAYLYSVFGNSMFDLKIPFVNSLNIETAKMLINAIEKKVNSPLYSSAGRLFDAVSAIINLCTKSSYQAEAPMKLESVIDEKCCERYSFNFDKVISFNPTIFEIVKDLEMGTDISKISAKFHNTLTEVILSICIDIKRNTGINTVALSGGVFQNRYVFEKSLRKLKFAGFNVITHSLVSANDSGIALGQMIIAKSIST